MASPTATVINLTKTALGAGMLAIPFAFKCQGILLASFSLILGAVTTVLGVMLLAYCSGFLPHGKSSFFEVCSITYPALAVVFDLAIALKCFGVCVSYLVIIGNLMPTVTSYFGFETSQMLWLVLTMLIVTPLSLQKSLESLKTASLVALSSVLYLIVIVVVHFVKQDTIAERGPVSWIEPQSLSSVISSVPIIIFAYTCAQNVFLALNELDQPTSLYEIFIISCKSTGIAMVTYFIVGILGYLSFGDHVGDNLISMYSNSLSSTLGRLAIAILVLCSYPLMCHPSRASVMNVIEAYQSHSEPESEALLDHEPRNPKMLPSLVTVVILALSFVLATTLNSLELILSFVGATGATAVSFILPGLFGYKLSSTTRENRFIQLSDKQSQALKLTSLLLFFYGICIAVLAVGVNISRLVN